MTSVNRWASGEAYTAPPLSQDRARVEARKRLRSMLPIGQSGRFPGWSKVTWSVFLRCEKAIAEGASTYQVRESSDFQDLLARVRRHAGT